MKFILIKGKKIIETSDFNLVRKLRARGFNYKYSNLGELL